MKAGIIGFGSIGQRHLGILAVMGHEVAVFDSGPMVLPRNAELFSMFPTWNELVDWADVVFVCTPPASHVFYLYRVVIEAKKPVFVEKPLSDILSPGLQEMIQIAKRRRLVTMVGCNWRFSPQIRDLKEHIEKGKTGKPLLLQAEMGSYLPAWRKNYDYRNSYNAHTSVVLDSIHEIDYATWLLGPVRESVSMTTRSRTLGIEAVDIASLLLRHDSGAISSIHLDYLQKRPHRRVTLITEGDRLDAQLIANDTMYVQQMDHFMACVESKTQTICPLHDALPTLEVALKVQDCP